MHERVEIDEDSSKPEIIHDYNETKVEVDTFDQMCSNMNSNKKTPSWNLTFKYSLEIVNFIICNKLLFIVIISLFRFIFLL